jgi:hypothetical protein
MTYIRRSSKNSDAGSTLVTSSSIAGAGEGDVQQVAFGVVNFFPSDGFVDPEIAKGHESCSSL